MPLCDWCQPGTLRYCVTQAVESRLKAVSNFGERHQRAKYTSTRVFCPFSYLSPKLEATRGLVETNKISPQDFTPLGDQIRSTHFSFCFLRTVLTFFLLNVPIMNHEFLHCK